jgi:aerobic-type carbon monoxide dehydrogenase small subunit (CoxS/CutS family)
MSEAIDITLTVNGRPHHLSVRPNRVVADVLREDLLLTGCKIGCDQAVCGACTVLVDGMPFTGCTTFAFELDGRQVMTIEGLAAGEKLHPVQRAFLEHGAFQCGFCPPGMILSTIALLARHPDPEEALIREWLGANICRCTGYRMIVEAIRAAAKMVSAKLVSD